MRDSDVIGVFDSGIGGLTVLSAMEKLLPHEPMVYLGDTARLPYGTKSADTVVSYSLNNARALAQHYPLKMLVVACATASSVALEALRNELSIPVVGVIEPGAARVVDLQAHSVAVLATPGTIRSQSFSRELLTHGFKGDIYPKACPLFVPLVEEGMINGAIAEMVAKLYLQEIPQNIEAIILGCTHYPLLAPLLKTFFPASVNWIDCGEQTAIAVKKLLQDRGQLASANSEGKKEFLVTEAPARFSELAEFFLGRTVAEESVKQIDVGTKTP